MASETSLSRIERQLEAARQRLLDLTMRNRLLNFRPIKSSTLRIIDEIPAELFDLMVLNERVMEFLPKKTARSETGGEGGEELDDPDEGLTEAEEQILWSVTDAPDGIADRHTDKYLQTTLDRQQLQKRLFFIQKKAQSVLEEQGYSILYLALGFLEWKESIGSTQLRKAPLVLIPIDLYRTSVGSSFRLRWTGEDLQTNVSLQAKLKEQGVAFPDFGIPEAKDGIYKYFQEVDAAVRKEKDWNVNSEVFLGFFSFTKFLMYKDLDPNAWPEGQAPSGHPLIKSILDPQEGESYHEGFPEEEIDKRLSAKDLFHVMDADPSQIAVIEDAKAGNNLVVEGPPGTGKSQTITNMIAELLGTGRSVLFVSEKMAALDVVKSRLDQVGLGDFCLELHSRKSKKREVIDELKRCIQRGYDGPEYSDALAAELDATKVQLNAYAEALRAPIGAMQRSPHSLFCTTESVRTHFALAQREVPDSLSFSNTLEWTPEQYTEARDTLRDLADVLGLVHPTRDHPWRGCSPGLVLPADESEISKLLSKLQEDLDLLETRLQELHRVSGVRIAESARQISGIVEAAPVIAECPLERVDRSTLFHEDWFSASGRRAHQLIDTAERFQTKSKRLNDLFRTRVLERDIQSLLSDFKPLSVNFFRIFDSQYRKLKREIRQLYRDKPPRRNETVIAQLEDVVDTQQLRKELADAEQKGKAVFQILWQGEGSNPKLMKEFAAWVSRFHEVFRSGLLTDLAVQVLGQGNDSPKIKETAELGLKQLENFQRSRGICFQRIQIDLTVVFETDQADPISFKELRSKLQGWIGSLSALQPWSRFEEQRKQCIKTVALELIKVIDADRLAPEDIIPAFELGTAESLLREAFQQRPALASFIGDLHEKKIQRFVDLDCKLIELNRTRLAKRLQSQRPRLDLGASSGSQLGILKGEFSRQRGHMPIRKLMKLTGPIIQKLKPCFMMSPLSIAQFLEPTTASFDAIIFDEASQVKPEDALGAFLRGKRAIIVGDTKQLPPTAFFDLLVESDDREEEEYAEAYLTDTESILHQCQRCFQTKRLKWHYRSKHESLIAVSNQEFYDNGLLFYPSPFESSHDLGVHFKQLSDAVYDRGRSSVNRIEARAVAEACIEHYRRHPNKSLGVGTFNIKQQQAIWEEIELQLRRKPEMEDYFASSRPDHFFVKNLETIQGDERDVIFLSIGFGFDASRQLTLNFGPLNHDGGWRRLNVLITRAREKTVVFSSFRASDLNLQPNTPWGVRALKAYLQFAETRNLIDISGPRHDSDSPFETAVHEFLHSHGYEVKRQVGCAGFRVDLGVVNPEIPGCYLVGIECDGAKYHSSAVARDRDRLRQQILESQGWRILRLWSTDWYRNRAQTQERLLTQIEKIGRSSQAAQPPQLNRPRTIEQQPSVVVREIAGEIELKKLEDAIEPYRICSSLPFVPNCEIHESSTSRLVEAVCAVVSVEAPVHEDEVIRRIRTLWGLKRSGPRIQICVSRAIQSATSMKKITKHQKFLWWPESNTVKVRRRGDAPPASIELICDEEIAEAIRLVLQNHFATFRDDLVTQSARLFGIQAVHEVTSKRVNQVVDKLIREGVLTDTGTGMLDLNSRE